MFIVADKPKKKDERKGDRHRGAVPSTIRLKPRHRKAVENLVELFGSDLTEEIHNAIRERAQAHGCWPAPEPPE